MIAFWRAFFARWDPPAHPRSAIKQPPPSHQPFPGAVPIGWALGLLLLFALIDLPTPGASQNHACPAAAAASHALCDGHPESRSPLDLTASDAGRSAIAAE